VKAEWQNDRDEYRLCTTIQAMYYVQNDQCRSASLRTHCTASSWHSPDRLHLRGWTDKPPRCARCVLCHHPALAFPYALGRQPCAWSSREEPPRAMHGEPLESSCMMTIMVSWLRLAVESSLMRFGSSGTLNRETSLGGIPSLLLSLVCYSSDKITRTT
jgi:hypothetical protein